MWNDAYAPTSQTELVWSRQKQDALLAILRGVCTGTQRPRALLLYGPPGCAKLSSLCVLLHLVASELDHPGAGNALAVDTNSLTQRRLSRGKPSARHQASAPGPRPPVRKRSNPRRSGSPASISELSTVIGDVLNATSEFTAVRGPVRWRVCHTCDCPLQRYSQVLRSILHELVECTLDTGTKRADTSVSSASLPTTSAYDNPREPDDGCANITAHIVKLYGERATDELHKYTAAFIRQYEQLVDAAWDERRQVGDAASLLLKAKLKRHLVVFIHTTHDMHNDKVDLARALPSALLQSRACELFHCTPITAINMRRRVSAILEKEAARQLACSRDDAAARSLSPANKKRKAEVSSSSASLSPHQPSRDTTAVVIVDEDEDGPDTELLATPARQARAPTPAAVKRGRRRTLSAGNTATHLISPAQLEAIIAAGQGDVRQTLLQAQWEALCCRADVLDYRAEAPDTLDRHAAVQYVLGRTAAKDEETTRRSQTSSDVVLISDSDDDNGHGKPVRGDAALHGGAALPVSSSLASPLASAPRSLLELLDEPLPSPSTTATTTAVGTAVSASSTAADGVPSGGPDRRHTTPTARDEYLDLSHATARLLTQKYTLEDVTSVLNVPPRKLLEYMTNNNLPYYFTPAQMEACAICAEAGSQSDALRPADALAAGSNYRRNQLASRRTADDDADGMASSVIDTMALSLYDRACRVHHADVHVPRHFAAMRPPPFLREAYPRVRETNFRDGTPRGDEATQPRRRRRTSLWSHETLPLSVTDVLVDDWTEQHWRQAARERLANPPADMHFHASWGQADSATTRSQDTLSARLRRGAAPSADRYGHTAATNMSPPILVQELDVLREYMPETVDACGPCEPLVLDYVPYAQYIVLCRPLAASRDTPVRVPSPPASTDTSKRTGESRRTTFAFASTRTPSERPAATATSSGGPRRTTFSFTAAPVTSAPASKRPRVCTDLRLAILRRGLSESVVLREPVFAVRDTFSGGVRAFGQASIRADAIATDELPLIPDGESIEDFSD